MSGRQSVNSRLAGNEDLNDAARLAADLTFRKTGSPKDLGQRRDTDRDGAPVAVLGA